MIADRWGVTDAETVRHYPCDDFVAMPVLQAWRGVTVAAPASAIWPWICQIQVAPYSSDLIDNLGRRSPRTLIDVPEPAVGTPFTATAGRRIGRILAVEPGRHLTGTLGHVVMTYWLEPVGAETRLLLKLTADRGRLTAPLLSLGDLVMARRQLLNLRDLAEGRGAG
jgi:hypothetical protein